MPLFSNSTPFDGDVEKATSEMNTSEDWALIMDICDKVGRTPNGAKDCLKSVVKRLNHRIPHVSMQATTLLDACVNNCGRAFQLEIASRDFVSEARTLINGKAHPKVSVQLKQLIKKWAQNDFKNDPALDMIPTLYNSLMKEGVDFSQNDQAPAASQPAVSKDPNVVQSQQEEDDIAKAIAMSLEEEEKKKGNKTGSLYPTFSAAASSSPSSAPASSSSASSGRRELRKVRALYDFEAAEDNELTFKAGELVSILDDSDTNWWKGSTWRGEGLFPANFVTADLSVEVEDENAAAKEKKSVQFNEEVEVKEVDAVPDVVEINEEQIDKCLNLLQNADPTGETTPDPPEMSNLEEQCKAMGPLIDTELEKIDGKHNQLMDINTKLMDALQMYHHLMKELPAYGYGSGMAPPPMSAAAGAAGGGKMMMPPQQQEYYMQQQQQPPMYNGGQQQQPQSSMPQAYTSQHYSVAGSTASSNGNMPPHYSAPGDVLTGTVHSSSPAPTQALGGPVMYNSPMSSQLPLQQQDTASAIQSFNLPPPQGHYSPQQLPPMQPSQQPLL